MEMKLMPRDFSMRTFLVQWIQFLSSIAQNYKDGKGLDAIYCKNPQNFNVDSFCWQNSFWYSFWFAIKSIIFNQVSFFLTSYDLNYHDKLTKVDAPKSE